MAQKSKKQARKTSAVLNVETPRPATNAPVVPGSSTRSYTTEFNPDYSQTIKDLKRIGILASSFFGILILLSFILR